VFDLQTAILYDLDPVGLRGGGRLVVADPKLEPRRAGVVSLRVPLAHSVEDLRDLPARAEDVDEVDRLRHVAERVVRGLSEDLIGEGVHRNHPIPPSLEVRRHVVSGLPGRGRAADDRDRLGVEEAVEPVVVGGRHGSRFAAALIKSPHRWS